MTSTVLFTLGTPFGSWLPLANALHGSAAGGVELRLEPQGCWTLEALAAQFPQANFLIFVESPSHALGEWLTQNAAEDAATALERWCDAVRRILRHVQRHLPRCVLVDAGEARRHGAALAALCSERFGFVPAGSAPVGSAPDALAAAVGAVLAAADGRAGALYAELHASCVPLCDDDADSMTVGAAHGIEAHEALDGWRALQSGRRALHEKLEQHRLVLREHEERATAEAVAARQDNARLQADVAELRQALQVAHGEAGTLRQQVGNVAVLQQQCTQSQCEADAAKREADLLLLQLHQVQEELEHYYLAWRELQDQSPPPSAAVTKNVEQVVLGTERLKPPHRELGLTLQSVRAGGRVLGRVDARLVEHHGRPGVALFAAEGQPTPLMAWQPSGREEGRDYLLLVPADAPAAQRLQSMGRGDWELLLQLVDATVAVLEHMQSETARRWQVVAERLRRQLAALPARLRYDRIEAAPAADAPGAIDASFAPVSFGSREMAELRLRWWPRPADGGALELLLGADAATPPLAHWPVEADGRWAPLWRLPLGELARSEREHAWRALGAEDRALLLGVLDALPAVAQRASAALGAAVGDASELRAAAALPLRTAQRALHGSRGRRVWRALRGRIA